MSLLLISAPEIEDTQNSVKQLDQAIDVVLGGIRWKVMLFPEGLNRKLLNTLYNTLMAYISWHSKILVIRFDVSLYDSLPNNNTISKLRSYILKHLKSHYNSKAEFGWVREQNRYDDKCHYHCFVLLNGQKAKSSYVTFDLAKKARELIIDINIHFPENCTYMILPNTLSSIQAALYRLSYLVKNVTKENNPAFAKGHYFGRIKHKA
ncbi:inovirus Gp2 family protein [Shewanella sp. 1CM18E]|uniref:YagK/YfjJ domain-containing protein n=1 Tax=Shewanella sp. 1CM18E TaxID=2929169 RepID=UPI0020BE1A2C|nr:inovirus-type Gp2 protein [Shewanella sp. 1CM18E]MCK8047162.1 inovirus Gp2 family protein [Shewanella sp. 1CM18E]